MPPSTPTCMTMQTIKGFTLIEMIIVMVISGIIFSISTILLSAGFRSYFTAVNVTGLNNQATLAMARMSKELQQAVSFNIINATNVSFKTTGGSTIQYSWASPVITRTGLASQTLNDQTTSFSLSYYQSDFTATATLSAVRAITINMTLSDGDEIVPMINTVFLSNMK